jgi:hypothetical protein
MTLDFNLTSKMEKPSGILIKEFLEAQLRGKK